jgi:hypothetical protein
MPHIKNQLHDEAYPTMALNKNYENSIHHALFGMVRIYI